MGGLENLCGVEQPSFLEMVATGCTRNVVSQVDIDVSSEGRKAPGARTSVGFGALFWLIIWHYNH